MVAGHWPGTTFAGMGTITPHKSGWSANHRDTHLPCNAHSWIGGSTSLPVLGTASCAFRETSSGPTWQGPRSPASDPTTSASRQCLESPFGDRSVSTLHYG
jgi:hypothetical protein